MRIKRSTSVLLAGGLLLSSPVLGACADEAAEVEEEIEEETDEGY